MREYYLRHRLLIVNTCAFLTVGILLSWLFHQVAYALLSLVLGGLLGWLGEWLQKALKVSEGRVLRWTLIVLLAEALLFIYVGMPAIGAYGAAHPVRHPIEIESDVVGRMAKEATFRTQDGLTLTGWYYAPQNGAAVIVAHGLNANRTQGIHQVRMLVEAGYGVLAIDLRAHGESQGRLFAGTTDVGLDVQAAAEYLQSKPEVESGRIGGLGLSVGANAVLYAAASGAPLQALIADGTGMARTEDALEPMLPEIRPLFFGTPLNRNYHRFLDLFSGVRAPAPLKEIVAEIAPTPVLFIAGEGEWLEPALDRRYAAAVGESGSVWLATGSGHLGAIYDHTTVYQQRMLSFYDTYLSRRD